MEIKNYASLISPIIDQIYAVLKHTDNKSISLMEGLPGVILFLHDYGAYFKDDKIVKHCEELIDELIENFNSTEETISETYCDGLIGLIAFCDYMQMRNDKDYFDFDEDLVEYMNALLVKNLREEEEYDFLHGGLGIMYYLIRKYKLNASDDEKNKISLILSQGLDMITDLAIVDELGCRWNYIIKDDERFENKPFFNMGVAHGLPGIINILAELHILEINKERTGTLLESTYKFIRSLRNKTNDGHSQFQTYYVPHFPLPYDSPLAWCYGDLGLSISIHKAGRALQNQDIIDDAIDIALKTTLRKTEEETEVTDAEFCHGSMGVSHLYSILYEYTQNEVFMDAQHYWIEKTLSFSNHPDGLAGFRTHEKGDKWGKDIGLMKGIAGIGLSLISYLSKDRRWDQFFLLD